MPGGGGAGSGLPTVGGAAGAEVVGAGLTPGGRVAGSSLEPSAIATAVPTSSTATTVLTMITAGRRYHGMTGGSGFASGGVSWSNASCGRAEV
ncbi:hypothetical protein LAUMK4_03280 [Mycobacterium persicum]|uniref:Uncharacterized protein n=1 Tax=Mycobacterium persicum TaxID=1487726 RepID=A0AB38UV82_9MYCO|nr:hypothetical protein LAUMK15_03590 [Mycobacterium persicum]VAZ84507.1 hypothetical protein LAUMK42_03330 [Mycobacterium persicum]VAZ95831.1 hypothetical protein LAUMK4_03280 [Mycobacterium persicum]